MPEILRLIIEGRGCCRNLSDLDAIYYFFEAFSLRLNLPFVVPPYLVRTPAVCPGGGRANEVCDVSGFTIWSNQCAHIHTWYRHKLATLDIHASGLIDEGPVINFFTSFFRASSVAVNKPLDFVTMDYQRN